jgi:Gpi18-like mannosyltransferase
MDFSAEAKAKDLVIEKYRYVFVVVITVFAFWLRLVFRDVESMDCRIFFEPWFDHLSATPGLTALSESFSNYSPLYLYFLKFATLLPFSKLFSIKFFPIIFDFLLAIYASKIIGLFRPYSRNLRAWSYGVMLFIPTVLINSSFWGQCDSMPAALVVAAVYYLLKRSELLAFLALGIALSFKLQAVFILPVFVICYFRRRFSLLYFLIVPAVYFVSVLPAYFAGRPLGELLAFYSSLIGFYKELTLNAPTIYQLFYGDFETYNRFGVILGLSVAFLIVSWTVLTVKELTDELILKVSLLFLILLPYILPQMHDRYFYLADVTSVIAVFALNSRKYLYISATMILVSFLSYGLFLFDRQPIVPFPWMALIMLAMICVLVGDIFIDRPDETGHGLRSEIT